MRLTAAVLLLAAAAPAMDLTRAWVSLREDAGARQRTAAALLVDEVERRTGIRWPLERSAGPEIRIVRGSGPAEGYRVRIDAAGISVSGNDDRGILFGAGRLLRVLKMSRGAIQAPDSFDVSTAPRYKLRGHQLGYRPKTNSYDGWTVAMWEQYIRDLAVFGTNAVELIPPRSDDDPESPHFPLPPMRMLREMTGLLDKYGMDVWIWYPAMDEDYSAPSAVEASLKEWGEVFQQARRVDAVFVPGGDPGHTPPRVLMSLLEKQTRNLHRFHPKAQMWVSPQGFTQPWLDEFLGILKNEQPAWLTGVVYGPQVKGSIQALREAVPKRYAIRHYPDITHTRQCQFPVPDWDIAYSLTEAREPVNPRPMQYARIFQLYQPLTTGFITYSEGCNDDVNKFVWSALGWDPDANVAGILREYSRYFLGPRYEDVFAQGLLALERNWEGPLAANAGVYDTLAQFQAMERQASPQDLLNWRFQQALYRAYYDAYTRRRLLYENELEEQALDTLRSGGDGARTAAARILDRAVTQPVAQDWRARIFSLAEALYQSVRMQLSVDRYRAIAVGRGANLDTIDVPLNNRIWLERALASSMPVERIVNWTDPGPGGFYDDLGDRMRQPHLVTGPGFDQDPAFLQSAMESVVHLPGGRRSWMTFAQSLHEQPLRMRYQGLDPAGRYRVRVTYSGDAQRRRIRLVAGDGIEIHGFIQKKDPVEPVEFELPQSATRTGELVLTWTQEPGLGGNGRGCQVAEVWLVRQ